MSERIPSGVWVQVHEVLLRPAERAPGLPPETAAVPYEGWVKGFLTEPATPGELVTIQTLAGRRVTGTLVAADPGYSHSFGAPHPAVLSVGPALRQLLAREVGDQ